MRASLRPKSREALRSAATAIIDTLRNLARHLYVGRHKPDLPHYREPIIDFDTAGYVALYRVNGKQVTVVALPAGSERGYLV